MLSRTGTGYSSQTGDQLAQAYNALLLANANECDWLANPAAAPQLGATSAYASGANFTDGVHPTDTGQAFYVAAEKCAFEGVVHSPVTNVSGNYTQKCADSLIVQNSSSNSTLTLINANYGQLQRCRQGVLQECRHCDDDAESGGQPDDRWQQLGDGGHAGDGLPEGERS